MRADLLSTDVGEPLSSGSLASAREGEPGEVDPNPHRVTEGLVRDTLCVVLLLISGMVQDRIASTDHTPNFTYMVLSWIDVNSEWFGGPIDTHDAIAAFYKREVTCVACVQAEGQRLLLTDDEHKLVMNLRGANAVAMGSNAKQVFSL
jgi:hypothetical protein